MPHICNSVQSLVLWFFALVLSMEEWTGGVSFGPSGLAAAQDDNLNSSL